MTRNQQFFLDTLADYLWERKTNPPDGVDWKQILFYARSHQVEGIFWNQCREYIQSKPELNDVKEKLELASVATLFIYANNRQALKELKHEFYKEKVHFFFVKGMNVAALYPIPEYRTMGDIDIVMPSIERERIHDVLIRLGYRKGEGERVKVYIRNSVHLEIHDQLVNPEKSESAFRCKYFNECWKYVKDINGIGVLNWEFHILFLVEHTRHHFSTSGAGFRQFMDLAVCAKNKTDVDWLWIEQELRKTELWDFASTAFAFCKKWWSIDAPLTTTLDESFYQESTEFVFKNGVFGHDNEHSDVHFVEKQMRMVSLPKSLRPIRVAIKRVCISYSAAVMLPYLSFIKDKKYLLPFAWIYRVFFVAINKKGNIRRAIKLIFGSGEIISSHKRLMDRWGV